MGRRGEKGNHTTPDRGPENVVTPFEPEARDLPSVQLNPALPKGRRGSDARRTTIIDLDGYIIVMDDTVDPVDKGQIHLNPMEVLKPRNTAHIEEMIKLKDEFIAEVQRNKRNCQNALSLRDVLGPEEMRAFNFLYIHRKDENGLLDPSSITTGDILRKMELEAQHAKELPENILPTLRTKLEKIWGSGPTTKRGITSIVQEVYKVLRQHLHEHSRSGLFTRPQTNAQEEKVERKEVVRVVIEAFPKWLSKHVEEKTMKKNQYVDDPHAVLLWLQKHLPGIYKYVSGYLAATSAPDRSKPKLTNHSNSPARSRTNQKHNVQLARSKRQVQITQSGIRCHGCGELGHTFR